MAAGTGDGEELAVCIHRGGAGGCGAETTVAPAPLDFQILEIRCIDLVQGRGTSVPGVATDIAPFLGRSGPVIDVLGQSRDGYRTPGKQGQQVVKN